VGAYRHLIDDDALFSLSALFQTIDDNSIVKSKNNEFCIIPDAAVYGG
jgi:hypothetical protein